MAKILFLVSEDWYFISHRLPLARHLKKNGHEITVMCKVKNARQNIEKEGFSLVELKLDRENISPRSALKTISLIKSHYKREKPDIVIQVSLFMVLLGTLAALQTPIKRIVNLVTGLGFVFIAESLKAKIMRFAVTSFFKLFSFSRKVQMVVQNRDDEALMQSLWFKTGKNLSVIRGSGVNATQFVPAKTPPTSPLITFVGRMLWAKGVEELIEAARILKQRGKSYRIALVGDPDPGNPQSASEQDIERWKGEEIVEFWGRRSDIAEIYQQSTIAILPSWREGLPKSLLEAASSGLPMITTDVPGCREIVEHEKNGLLVPLKDAEGLANAMERLMEDEPLRNEMGKQARLLVENELNDVTITEKTAALIVDKIT